MATMDTSRKISSSPSDTGYYSSSVVAEISSSITSSSSSSSSECSDHQSDESYQESNTEMVAFNEPRHKEPIEGLNESAGLDWRVYAQTRTESIGLVLCLNLHNQLPPEGLLGRKPNRGIATMQAWRDPLVVYPDESANRIRDALIKQYQECHSWRRNYQSLIDPTMEAVRYFCRRLRQDTGPEHRVLFHYNGHGMPTPTDNGEIWVFSLNYAQYVPISMYDLQVWLGSPTVYLFDCANAGGLIEWYLKFAERHQLEYEMRNDVVTVDGDQDQDSDESDSTEPPPKFEEDILFAACRKGETLMIHDVDMPADLFTACMTTPARAYFRWFVQQRQTKGCPPFSFTIDELDKLPNTPTDRRSILGELNWLLITITETIAWRCLPLELFQRLYHHDVMVGTLFRNFLVAQRVMPDYGCTPVSHPPIKPLHQHPLWDVFDYVLDNCLGQLSLWYVQKKRQKTNENTEAGYLLPPYQMSQFFSEQMTAFEVWLRSDAHPGVKPRDLPSMLQSMLSPVHRDRALGLLDGYLNLGPWAVKMVLTVGSFPYLTMMIHSKANAEAAVRHAIAIKAKAEADAKKAAETIAQGDVALNVALEGWAHVVVDPMATEKTEKIAKNVVDEVVEEIIKADATTKRLTDEEISNAQRIVRAKEDLAAVMLLRPHVVSIWAKVCALDENFQMDLTREKVHKYFMDILSAGDLSPHHLALTAFIVSFLIRGNRFGQHIAIQWNHQDQNGPAFNVFGLLLIEHPDDDPNLRKWLLICLGHTWDDSEAVRELATRCASYRDIFPFLEDPVPEVRAAAAYALGTFMGSINRRERLAIEIDCHIAWLLVEKLFHDSSPVVRQEVLVALQWFIAAFEVRDFRGIYKARVLAGCYTPRREPVVVAEEAEEVLDTWSPSPSASASVTPTATTTKSSLALKVMRKISQPWNKLRASVRSPTAGPSNTNHQSPLPPPTITQVISPSNPNDPPALAPEQSAPLPAHENVFGRVWQMVELHCHDPCPEVAQIAQAIFSHIHLNCGLFPVAANVPMRMTLQETNFIDWCTKHIYQSLAVTEQSIEDDPQLAEWRFSLERQQKAKLVREKGHWNSPSGIEMIIQQRNVDASLMVLHPFEECLVLASGSTFSVCKYDPKPFAQPMAKYSNESPSANITDLQLINTHDKALLMVASDDGAVKIWRNVLPITNGHLVTDFETSPVPAQPRLSTAFFIFEDMLLSYESHRLLVWWEQCQQRLVAGGEHHLVRLWDANTERKICDIVTDTDVITSLCSDYDHLICTGGEDGVVRVFDDRQRSDACQVFSFRNRRANGPIVNAKIWPEAHSVGSINIVSGNRSGDVCWYDRRATNKAVRVENVGSQMTAMNFQENSDVFACAFGTDNSTIQLFSLDTLKGTIHQQPNGAVKYLAFHSLKSQIALATSDASLAIYQFGF